MTSDMACDCKNKNGYSPERRNFLTKMIFSLSAVIGAGLGYPLILSLLAPATDRTKAAWRKVGLLTDFPIGETKQVTFKNPTYYEWSRKISHSAAWVRRDKDGVIVAFSVNCSHLGCPVRWEESPEMFFCPCHGGAFYRDGSRAAGPPNRGLYKYPVRLRNGDVELKISAIPITNMSV